VITKTAEKISPLGMANSSAVRHPAGTVILSRTASVGFSAILGDDMATSQDFATWKCGSRLDRKYLLHALRAMAPDLRRLAMGSTHKTVYMPDIAELRIPLPPVEEQRRIADFLDAETARIDEIVGVRQRTIKLLSERRASLVYAAVTGAGSRPRRRVPLIWTPTLPVDWLDGKLSLFARMGSGHTPSRSREDWWLDCTIPWVTTGEVSQLRDDRREEILETRERISEVGLVNSAAELCPKGTVVLCRTAASAGYSAVMGTAMATSQDFVTWQCGPKLDPFYLLWCLRAMRSDLLGRLAMGSTHRTIYVPDLQMLRIPVPPLVEQREIVASIREDSRRIDASVDAIHRQMELLTERRQALITAAVMGQFDVTAARGVELS